MIVVHTGFDGLDVAFKTSATPELIAKLTEAQKLASDTNCEPQIEYNGVHLRVAETGGRGGYAFRFDTGPDGGTWFVKRPKPGDSWGVRVSCHSRGLGLNGLKAVRDDLERTCAALGFVIGPDGVSIGRVDFAIDIFAPEFLLDPEAFVMHARTRRKTYSDLDKMQTHGPSGRYSSVTIGKQPGRQIIVYDKRQDVMDKGKVEWPMIWNTNLDRMGQPRLEPYDINKSQVWRVELRLGKKALRERANIRGWSSFYEALQAEMNKLAQDVTLHAPSSDTNRSRWPLHPLWRVVQDCVARKLFDHDADVPPDAVREINLVEKQQEFLRTIAAHLVTLSVLEDCYTEEFPFFLEELPARIVGYLLDHPRDINERFAAARNKYADVLG